MKMWLSLRPTGKEDRATRLLSFAMDVHVRPIPSCRAESSDVSWRVIAAS